jgi:hypothetical protein
MQSSMVLCLRDGDVLDLRLSALSAFLGVIRPCFRRVSITAFTGSRLKVEVLLDANIADALIEEIREDVSCAVSEIYADLPADTGAKPYDIDVEAEIVVSDDMLLATNADAGFLIYLRWEPTP